MTRTALATMVLAIAMAPLVVADSVKNLNVNQVSIGFSVDVSGDNMGFSFNGPTTNFNGGGGTVCDYCSFLSTFAPGDSVNLSVGSIYYGFFGNVKLGGIVYDSSLTSVNTISSIFAGSITFPAGGSDFRVTVPATFDSIIPVTTGTNSASVNFNLHTPSKGQLTVAFIWSADSGTYTFASGNFVSSTVVPEPATLSLTLLGLSAIAGAIQKKRSA